MLCHHTGAQLWQCKKTNKEMAELFVDAVVACVGDLTEIIPDCLFALLHRWVCVDYSHRESFVTLPLPSACLSPLAEHFTNNDAEDEEVCVRKQNVLCCIVHLMRVGYRVEERVKEEKEE